MKNLKMVGKIVVYFGLIFMMTILMSFAGFSGLNKLRDTNDIYADTTIPAIEDVWTARRGVQAIEREILEIAISKTQTELTTAENELMTERQRVLDALNHLAEIAPQCAPQVSAIKQAMERL